MGQQRQQLEQQLQQQQLQQQQQGQQLQQAKQQLVHLQQQLQRQPQGPPAAAPAPAPPPPPSEAAECGLVFQQSGRPVPDTPRGVLKPQCGPRCRTCALEEHFDQLSAARKTEARDQMLQDLRFYFRQEFCVQDLIPAGSSQESSSQDVQESSSPESSSQDVGYEGGGCSSCCDQGRALHATDCEKGLTFTNEHARLWRERSAELATDMGVYNLHTFKDVHGDQVITATELHCMLFRTRVCLPLSFFFFFYSAAVPRQATPRFSVCLSRQVTLRFSFSFCFRDAKFFFCLLPLASCLLPLASCLLPLASNPRQATPRFSVCLSRQVTLRFSDSVGLRDAKVFFFCLLPLASCLLPQTTCLLPLASCLKPATGNDKI